MFTSIKAWIYGSLIAVFTIGLGYMVNQWHYVPIAHLSKLVQQQKIELKAKNLTIHNLSIQFDKMVKQNKVTGFEEYWKGYNDDNADISITDDFDDKLVF